MLQLDSQWMHNVQSMAAYHLWLWTHLQSFPEIQRIDWSHTPIVQRTPSKLLQRVPSLTFDAVCAERNIPKDAIQGFVHLITSSSRRIRMILGDYFEDIQRLARSTANVQQIVQRAQDPNDEIDFRFSQCVTWQPENWIPKIELSNQIARRFLQVQLDWP